MQTLIAPTAMPDHDLPQLGLRLRQLRDAASLTQMQLAMAAKLSLSLITQIEQGQRDDIKLSTASALAEALGVTVNDLVAEPEPPAKGRKRKEGGK